MAPHSQINLGLENILGRRAQIPWAWAQIYSNGFSSSTAQAHGDQASSSGAAAELSSALSSCTKQPLKGEGQRNSRPEMAAAGRIGTYEDFVEVHGLLLAASGLPQSLHRQLFQKLTSETFDGGAHFQVETFEDGRCRRLVLSSDSMAKESHVFLVDHAWTFRLSDAYNQVRFLY